MKPLYSFSVRNTPVDTGKYVVNSRVKHLKTAPVMRDLSGLYVPGLSY